MATSTNPFAFPHGSDPTDDHGKAGMSLRDWFAGQAPRRASWKENRKS